MRRSSAAACALALALIACADGGEPPRPGGSPARPPSATLRGVNVLLPPGEDGAIRIGIDPAEPSARMIVSLRPGAAGVALCPLASAADPLPDLTECRDAASGVRETVTAPGLRAIGIVSRATALVGVGLVVEFAERSRAVAIHFPLIRRPPGVTDCRDNACNPFFELTPTRGGRFRATARWQGGRGRLVLLQGRVLAKSFTATGVPYAEPARAEGAPPLTIEARMSAPAEYALALAQQGVEDLAGVVIDAVWPR